MPDIEIRQPTLFDDTHATRVHSPKMLHAIHQLSGLVEGLDLPDGLLFADTFPHVGMRRKILRHRVAPDNPIALMGAYCFDTITAVGQGTHLAAHSAMMCALTGAEEVLHGRSSLVLALTRPPGHHAGSAFFGGGAYWNNAAIAAQYFRDHGVGRVAILDLDFHHGNGTQDIFYARSDVSFTSIHGDPRRCFPYYSGHSEELGSGQGRGWNHNFLLEPGVDASRYRRILSDALGLAARGKPDVLVVSLGFDTHFMDIAGDSQLRSDDYRALGRDVSQLSLPTLLILEGGYDIESLGESTKSWIAGASATV
jgi:acetoin utilization deacetylase AcuC-like enzyme